MNKRFFDIAKKTALHSDHPDHIHGSVIVKKNRIVGLGYNSNRTHTKSTHPHRRVHSELSAILNTQKQDLSGCELYIIRLKKDGSLGFSKPCVFCKKLLQSVGIEKVHYSTDVDFTSEKY